VSNQQPDKISKQHNSKNSGKKACLFKRGGMSNCRGSVYKGKLKT